MVAQRHQRTYLCKAWTRRQRLETLLAHYRDVAHLPGFTRLLDGERHPLCRLPLKSGGTVRLCLGLSEFSGEGEIGLYLLDENGERLYSLVFTLGRERQLYIGGLQGPRPSLGEELVKTLTKELHGMRPKALLLAALQILANQWDRPRLLGISDRQHPRRSRLRSSYDAFWTEAEGHPCGDWFLLPTQPTSRPLDTIKSQHRAAYRRREALRERLAVELPGQLRLCTKSRRAKVRQGEKR